MAEKPEDFNMPTNVVARTIKEALPDGINVTPDVRSACSRCASIFILYVTTSANNIALKNKRKTLSPQDVIEAIEQIGFDEFTPELISFHEYIKTDRKSKQRAKNSNETSNSKKSSDNPIDNEEVADEEEVYLSDGDDD